MKYASDHVLDGALKVLAHQANLMVAMPRLNTTYEEAWATRLAEVTVDPFDFTFLPGEISGRRVKIAAKKGVPVLREGVASHIACLDCINGRVLYVTTCPEQKLVEGGTVSIAEWSVEIGAPV